MPEPQRAPLAQAPQQQLPKVALPANIWADSPRELIERLSRLGSLVGVLREQLSDYQDRLPPPAGRR
jgi:hypothetical protein